MKVEGPYRLGRSLAAFGAGQVFASGLVLSSMTDPQAVRAFLNLAGDWKPDLAFVMGGAVLVYGLGRALMSRRSRPLLDTRFHTPEPGRTIDGRLLTGATIFGLGWGLSGRCPGPALASLGVAGTEAALFTLSMLAGMALVTVYDRGWPTRSRVATSPTSPHPSKSLPDKGSNHEPSHRQRRP